MLTKESSLLIVLILICPFRSDSNGLLISDADHPENDEGEKPQHQGPCWELRDKPNLYFQAFGRKYWVALRPHSTVLNPYQPTREFKGFRFHTATEGHDFVPCLVRGSAVADGKSVEVYGNILNGFFSGFALVDGRVHHIRNAGLERTKRDLSFLKSDSYPSLFAAGTPSPKSRGNVTSWSSVLFHAPTIRYQPTTMSNQNQNQNRKTKPDSGQLYAKDCTLDLIADHTFSLNLGYGDIGLTTSLMTYYVQEADRLFRLADIDGDGQPDMLGFRVRNSSVFSDFSKPNVYPLRDETLTTAALLYKAGTWLMDPKACYVLLFTHRSFPDNRLGFGFAWNYPLSPWNQTGGKSIVGGACSANSDQGGQPNVGVVNLNANNRTASDAVAIMAVARVLAAAFGSRMDGSETDCAVPAGTYSATSGSFPPPTNLWENVTAGLSQCAIKDMRSVLPHHSSCLLSVLSVGREPQAASGPDYDYYDVSAACDPNRMWPVETFIAGLGFWIFGHH